MAKELSRSISNKVERELWARAGGRCEFEGCNILTYKSPVTQENVTMSQLSPEN